VAGKRVLVATLYVLVLSCGGALLSCLSFSSHLLALYVCIRQPNNVRSFAQTTSSHTIITHVLQCQDCPDYIRKSVIKLQQDEKWLPESAVYGSRKIFYDRVWSRLHAHEEEEEEEEDEEEEVVDTFSAEEEGSIDESEDVKSSKRKASSFSDANSPDKKSRALANHEV